MSAPLQLISGNRDLTRFLAGCTFSNTDPGGFEALTCQPDILRDLQPGKRITVRCGLDVAWDGIINEPGERDTLGRVEASVAAVGKRLLMQREPYREIYVDRDLSKWGPISISHQILSLNTNAKINDWSISVAQDKANGVPALAMTAGHLTGSTTLGIAQYDTQGIGWYYIYYNITSIDSTSGSYMSTGAGWQAHIESSTDDSDSDGVSTALASGGIAGQNGYYFRPNSAHNLIYLWVGNGSISPEDGQFAIFWRNTAVYGNAPLTGRGTDPVGFYPGDIVWDAHRRASNFGAITCNLKISNSSSYIVPHLVYMTPTTSDQVCLDMCKIMGWHYGIWEPDGAFSDQPTLWFSPPPTDATCAVFRTECLELQEPAVRFDKLFDTAIVSWRDPSGQTGGITTVVVPNPLAQQASVDAGTMTVDMGLGSDAAAQTFGRQVLLLSQSSARGSGSATLPDMVRTPTGLKPSCLLKAGRDRIRIADLPAVGSITATGSDRYDTFLIRRVETTVDEHGVPRTRVEFDTGADLLEVLMARLQIASTVAGVG